MKLLSSIVTLALCSTLSIGCKETNDKSVIETKTSITETTLTKNTIAINPEIATFKIDGMSCAMGCARTIEKKLASTDGIQEAKVDFDKKEATVNFDASKISAEKIQEIVENTADGKTYKVLDIKVKA